MNPEVFTVHQLNQAARLLMEGSFQLIWVKGELSNVALPRSGHIYFTLKDQHAQIRCAMFKGSNRRLNFTPTDGMAVLLRASVSIYEERGDYQLIVSHMEEAGLGQLQQAFEALKVKLEKEGLFDADHKKPFPRFPSRIGVITSHTGAAIKDILSVISRRYPIVEVTIYHTQVQGKDAAGDIIKALEWANQRQKDDVLILARGGGSLEDLWCFNEESVARCIYASKIPIISGIGHEVDFTIADFVADLRAPTPSAAAETITPNSIEVIQLFEQYNKHLTTAISRLLQYFKQKVDLLDKQLIHPGQRLSQTKLHCEQLQQRLVQAMQTKLQILQHKFVDISGQLHLVSPLSTLQRGYAIVTSKDTQEIIKDANVLKVGEKVETRLGKGKFVSIVEAKGNLGP